MMILVAISLEVVTRTIMLQIDRVEINEINCANAERVDKCHASAMAFEHKRVKATIRTKTANDF